MKALCPVLLRREHCTLAQTHINVQNTYKYGKDENLRVKCNFAF